MPHLHAFGAATRDSLSNLAASLNAGRDKAAQDSFFTFDLGRDQIEAMYRGDWLARKIVDIVPSDMVRAWREWSGHRPDVAAVEREERRLGLRKAVQRALVLGRLYGGGAIVIGTAETSAAALACELRPEALAPGGLRFLHVVSRWQVNALAVSRDPLDPWFGEPEAYEIVAPMRGALRLHPSRVVRFLGAELPDPTLNAAAWSDSVLQALYDAIHAVALTTAGATSLMHEAKVDVVTVPNLSEHLSSAATTAQLSARFAYAAAMKSINNLLLLGDGETWARQTIDFAGLPEMVRTFLQVAAGAADIPVTRLLGQSPAGLSATGDSDTRNYYDMIAARQEVDLRPQLERLDRLLLRSAGVESEAVSFTFRPLWQMDAASKAAIALEKAKTTQVYAGLKLWPDATVARLVEAQLVEDGTYPNAGAVFGETANQPGGVEPSTAGLHRTETVTTDFDPDQPRDPQGRWTAGGGSAVPSRPNGRIIGRPSVAPERHSPSEAGVLSRLLNMLNPIGPAAAQEIEPEEENHRTGEESADPSAELRIARYAAVRRSLKEIDPTNKELDVWQPTDFVPSEDNIQRLEDAARIAMIDRVCDFYRPDGKPIGQQGSSSKVRLMPGGLSAAQKDYDYLSVGGTPIPLSNGSMVRLPGSAGSIVFRTTSSIPGSPAIDINIPGVLYRKLHY